MDSISYVEATVRFYVETERGTKKHNERYLVSAATLEEVPDKVANFLKDSVHEWEIIGEKISNIDAIIDN